MAYISLDQVVKRYQMGEVTITAADHISFDIDKGEFVIIVGPSGAGKTTVLNILGGMDACDEGTITVDGDACAKPQNVVVPVGTAYQDILDYVGVKGELGKVVAGGAMMGPAVENLSYPTTKTTSGLILLSKAAAQPAQVNPCIRCGRCVEYCPMGLEPVEVNQAYAARDVQELGKLHADYCFNCGSCSFVCPAKRPVTQMMSLAKAFYLGEIKKGGNK